MIKKVLKAVIMGLWECEYIRFFAIMVIATGWLPLVSTLILNIFKININGVEGPLFIIAMSALGTMIFAYVIHSIEAAKYQDENHCDFSTAWRDTETDSFDDHEY